VSDIVAPARGALARALLAQFAYRALGAGLLGLPFARLLSAGVVEFPRGEALLYEPGAYYLIDSLLARRVALTLLSGATLWSIAVWMLLSLVPLWLTLDAVRWRWRPEPADVRARRELPSLLLLAGVTALLRLLTLSVTLGFMLSLRSMVDSSLDERSADLVSLLPALIGVVLLLSISLLQDLARSAVVAHGHHAASASLIALSVLRTQASTLLARYVPCTLLGALALALGAALVIWRAPVPLGGGAALGVLALQQLLVLAALGARVAWLTRAAAVTAAAGAAAFAPAGRARPHEDLSGERG
jgi:hypothetical protein